MNTTDDIIRELRKVIKQRQDEAARQLFVTLRMATGLPLQWSDVTVVRDAKDGSFMLLGFKFIPRAGGVAAVVRQLAFANRGTRYSLPQPGAVEITGPDDLLRVLQEFEPWE